MSVYYVILNRTRNLAVQASAAAFPRSISSRIARLQIDGALTWSIRSGGFRSSSVCLDLAIFWCAAATVGSVLRPQKPALVVLRLF